MLVTRPFFRTVMNYYNEHDPKAAAWLRELIKQGHIADGVVDERSIEDVLPGELAGFTQCHFFAGIGGWSYALRLAGWPDDRPVWTGSCPCQPFSAAGKGAGTADERHLWPAFYWLIAQCRPSVVYGEQVASKAGRDWFATVRSDLETSGYAVGAADLCAAGIGAPHIRQRLYFVAHASSSRSLGAINGRQRDAGSGTQQLARDGTSDLMADADSGRTQRDPRTLLNLGHALEQGLEGHAGDGAGLLRQEWEVQESDRPASEASLPDSELADAGSDDRTSPPRTGSRPGDTQGAGASGEPDRRGIGSHWADADWLPCRDGKARPVEPGTFPLAHGVPARVGRLRGYGNAIVPQAAAAFIESFTGVEHGDY